MFKNKHIIAALIITPLLAITAYFAVDQLVSENPHKALPGASYPLAEKPNCRYESGKCSLKNGDVEIDLHTRNLQDGRMELSLISAIPLEMARISLVDDPQLAGQPSDMSPVTEDRRQWLAIIQQPTGADSRIRMALSTGGVFYYGDTATTFTVYQTAFHKDFRRANTP